MYRVSTKNILHFEILIITSFFSFLVLLHYYALIYESAYANFLLSVIFIHGITCVSNDVIYDVIKFPKFSVTDDTEIG